jgi:hypothetical protein
MKARQAAERGLESGDFAAAPSEVLVPQEIVSNGKLDCDRSGSKIVGHEVDQKAKQEHLQDQAKHSYQRELHNNQEPAHFAHEFDPAVPIGSAR